MDPEPRALLELTRPGNAVAAGVLTCTGAFVAGGITGTGVATLRVGAAVGATITATGAGNAINDYFDREIDRINDPDRPIPRGAVSPRGALGFSACLFLSAVAFAVLLPPLAIAIALVNLISLVAYTEWFKGTPGGGNALVAYLGGSTFLFGGAAVGNPQVTVTLALLAALSTFAREVIKDVEDVDGDREEGLRTLPVAVGTQRALWIAVGVLVVAVVASPVPFVLGTFGVAYLLVVVPADAVMLYAAVESFSDPGSSHTHLKYGMFLAAMSFIAGRGAAVFLA
jgi:geranylgeranylglycerol-phosphate geranylgeranyltransferase